ncbi:MAG: ABC transporter substrate-binding protein [Stellaceae bacterium]
MKTGKLSLMIGLIAWALINQASAAGTFKIGLILPMTGRLSPPGTETYDGVETYLATHGTTVAGKKIEIILKDDGGVPDVTRRLAQELVVNDKVDALAGFTLTPCAASAATIATAAKVPQILMGAAGAHLTRISPYTVRVFETMAQVASAMGQWAPRHRIKKVVTMVADYGPGHDVQKSFVRFFKENGGDVLANLRFPVSTVDFAPFLQKAADASPQAIYVFAPEGPAAALIKQFNDRKLPARGIKFIGSGDFASEEAVAAGEAQFALGVITSQVYTPTLDTPVNKAFVAAYEKHADGVPPNVFGVVGYDGMNLIYKAIRATKGSTDGTKLVDAMKGMSWDSPRGPIRIDPKTRDIIQNVYVREFKNIHGRAANMVIATYKGVDPAPR